MALLMKECKYVQIDNGSEQIDRTWMNSIIIIIKIIIGIGIITIIIIIIIIIIVVVVVVVVVKFTN